MRKKNTMFAVLFSACLLSCGGGSPSGTSGSGTGAPNPNLPSGPNPGWKIAWGEGLKSARVVDPVTNKIVSETFWSVSSVFQDLLAETIPGRLTIDEGPNKGQSTNLRWKGTDIPYDNRYHPLTSAICKATTGGWAGFGVTGLYAVYQDENGVGKIYADHLLASVGMNVVSSHTVPGVLTPTACGAAASWFTAYYDRGSNGPGTIAF